MKKALHKAVRAMDSRATIQHNKLMQLENSMLMYGIYNAETTDNTHLFKITGTLKAENIKLNKNTYGTQ